MDANRRIIAKLRSIYKMYGKPELVDEYVSKGGHDYRPDLRIAIFKWINQHAKNDTTTPVEDTKFAELPGMLLRVFREDADTPKDAINAKIDETFVPRAKVELPEKGEFANWKKKLLTSLEQMPLRSVAEAPAAKRTAAKLVAGTLQTQENREVVFFQMAGKGLGFVVLDEKGVTKDDLGKQQIGLLPFALSGSWTRQSPPNYVERSQVLLGRPFDAGAVYDILASLRHFMKEIPAKELARSGLTLEGRGKAGILAAYAALFEPSIKEVVIIDPPRSHKEGPHFLGVLRVLDIPEALGLLAPNVKLTLINARDPAFDRTEQIYKLAGAADKLIRK
ncbi:MAG TPA: hypothetical protein VKE98_21175 [Gemmataceae bacterium]|nr:hypothetical protein [Gemmataceae bacterium]